MDLSSFPWLAQSSRCNPLSLDRFVLAFVFVAMLVRLLADFRSATIAACALHGSHRHQSFVVESQIRLVDFHAQFAACELEEPTVPARARLQVKLCTCIHATSESGNAARSRCNENKMIGVKDEMKMRLDADQTEIERRSCTSIV